MEEVNVYVLAVGLFLSAIGITSIVLMFKKKKSITLEAKAQAASIIEEANTQAISIIEKTEHERKNIHAKANAKVTKLIKQIEEKRKGIVLRIKQDITSHQERVKRLKVADKEITSRLKQSRIIIEKITDKSCTYAADIELLNEKDLLSSQTYQEDRKEVKRKLKKLAVDAIDGVKGYNANVNIGKFVSIAAKADMAGALLLTTVEMLCAKVNANNGHQALTKLAESVVATEALIKCFDSRAVINADFSSLLMKRLEIEIHFKKAKQIAKEEQRELKEQEREEKKAREEAERIQKEAENEERIKRAAIDELEKEMAQKSNLERIAYQSELERLKSELEEVHQRFERAKSRAQETKQGHVYIISNIGSFGEGILKIGMTRRMEPMDRVKELGDASVPFTFDVHALIESNDAPNLESLLHKAFNNRRVNKVNRRKEYFRISISEIEEELERLGIKVLINKVASADEYYQSIKQLSRQAEKDAL